MFGAEYPAPLLGILSCLTKWAELSNQHHNKGDNDQHGNKPPVPLDASGDCRFAAEFLFDKIVVIEVFFGQIEFAVLGFLGPAGFFVGAAFRTSPGVARDSGTAIRTYFRGILHRTLMLLLRTLATRVKVCTVESSKARRH